MVNADRAPATEESPASLTWTVWPAAKRPWLSVAAGLFVLALAGVASWSYGGKAYGVIALVVMVAAVGTHFVPARYELSDAGVRVRRLMADRRRPWTDFSAWYDAGEYLLLMAPLSQDVRRARVRGLLRRGQVLELSVGEAGAVRALVARHLPLGDLAELKQWLKTRS